MKPLLLTITQERVADIDLMTRNIYPTFQGILAVVNQPSNDGTFEMIDARKGDGKIIRRKFVPDHAFLMNELLFCGFIKEGQWCLFLDSPEEPSQKFLSSIPILINQFERDGTGALFWDGRPYLFKYSPYQEFHGACHWGINEINGHIVTTDNKDEFIINKRKLTPWQSWCLNPIKYYICYARGNECQAMYGKYGQNIVQKHEKIRREFRSYCKNHLMISLDTLDDLIKYMKKIRDKIVVPDEYFIGITENEFRLSELFQLKVLDMDFMTTMHPRYKWSFRNYLKHGDGWHDKNYLGTILRYDAGNFL